MIKIEHNHGTVIDTIHQAVIFGGCVCEKLEARTEKEPLGGLAEVPIPLHKMENSRDEREEWRMLPILLYQGHTMAEVKRTNEIIGIMCHRSAPELVAKLVQLDNEERILLDGLGARELHDMLLATYPGMTVSYGALREAMRLAG